MKKVIAIDKNQMAYIEKLFLEYTALLNITKYLCSYVQTDIKTIEKEIKKCTELYIELELAKRETLIEYLGDISGIKNYSFEFPTCELKYEVFERDE